MNKIKITLDELNVLSRVFPTMTLKEFMELKKQSNRCLRGTN